MCNAPANQSLKLAAGRDGVSTDIVRNLPGTFFAVSNYIPYNVPIENAVLYFELIEEMGKRQHPRGCSGRADGLILYSGRTTQLQVWETRK